MATQALNAARGRRAPAPVEPWLDAARSLHAWVAARDYAGHDPQDLLASPLVGRLTFGSRWAGVAWTQLGQRSPVDLRGVLRVPPRRNAKGIGLVLAACRELARCTNETGWQEEGLALRAWLDAAGVRAGESIGWGYPFPWANRDFFAPAGTPSSVATAFVGHALLDAERTWADERSLVLAQAAARFVLRELRRIPGPGATFAFSYTPLDVRVVHNANALAASLLARVAERTQLAGELADAACAAARFTVAAQRPDGSWPYGVSRRNQWVDSFHTSYLLVALDTIADCLKTAEWDAAIERGARYWQNAFLTGPAVGFSPHRPYPVDMHAVAHTIIALRVLERRIPAAREQAVRLASWSLRVMRADDGSFYYRHTGRRIIRKRFMRWTQAWMLLALSKLASWSSAP